MTYKVLQTNQVDVEVSYMARGQDGMPVMEVRPVPIGRRAEEELMFLVSNPCDIKNLMFLPAC